ncbi:MAG: Do family serine endopeptidase [Chlorobi bacterium]|nr:Do family serine endopeptidase [Chlorobiota bacterium]
MKTNKIIYTIIIAVVSAIAGVYSYTLVFKPEPKIITVEKNRVPASFASYSAPTGTNTDLTYAAEHSVHAVVHVMTKSVDKGYYGNPLYDFFFGPGTGVQPQPVIGSGSGVIITEDGYIVTNNHVIDGAEDIEVILNDKRSFKAKLVGTDPNTDIALLKIDAKNLKYLKYGDSDDLKLGEWVLAVGNPFNLTSTVTAGIVSAKARSINILSNPNNRFGIESFIQTDAAVNPGNSGGALVNSKGELVGINTAIASRTGSYTGYSFAVPINIAKKVVADLMEFGTVQRGFLGVEIVDVNKAVADELGLDKIEGVLIVRAKEGGAAYEAGIRDKDVVLSIDGNVVNSVPELQEQVGRHRPGDKLNILVKRSGKRKQFTVTLQNATGSTMLVSGNDLKRLLGAEFGEISPKIRKQFGLSNGIQVKKIYNGPLKRGGVREGYIITQANRIAVNSLDDLKRILSAGDEGLFLKGLYPNGRVVYYGINIDE